MAGSESARCAAARRAAAGRSECAGQPRRRLIGFLLGSFWGGCGCGGGGGGGVAAEGVEPGGGVVMAAVLVVVVMVMVGVIDRDDCNPRACVIDVGGENEAAKVRLPSIRQ